MNILYKSGKISLMLVLIISLVFGVWFYIGQPQIWQNPRIPPEIQETKARVKPLKFENRTINFVSSDNNAGGNLIIGIDKRAYIGLTQPEVYFSVFNFGSKEKLVKIQLYLPKTKEIVKDKEWPKNISYQVEVPEFGLKTLKCERGWTVFGKKGERTKYQCPTRTGRKIVYCDNLSEDKKDCYNSNAYLGFHRETKSENDKVKILANLGLKCKMKINFPENFLRKVYLKARED